MNELQNRAGFRFDERFHHDLSETIHDGDPLYIALPNRQS